MNTITQMLFWVSNSLLIPNIIILLILFIRSLILLGSFYNSFMMRRHSRVVLNGLETKSTEEIRQLAKVFHQLRHTLIGKYAHTLIIAPKLTEAEIDYSLNQFEIESDRDLSTSRLLSKVGPVLGLIGTLISMSPALLGLSTGNIESMAYNMQIVFATTVVGLVISLVGLVTQQYKQRWYAEELNALELIAFKLHQTSSSAAQTL